MDGEQSDDFNFYTLSDSEKILLSEVRAAVSAASSASLVGYNDDNFDHPVERFIDFEFVQQCRAQLEVLRSRGVAYSLKELVWFVLNLEKDPSYMAMLTGVDCTEAEAASAASSLSTAAAVLAPPQPDLLPNEEEGEGDGEGEGDSVEGLLERLRLLTSRRVGDCRGRGRSGPAAAAAATAATLPTDRPSVSLLVPDMPPLPPPSTP